MMRPGKKAMVVWRTDTRTVVLTGWKAWAASAVGMVILWLVLCLVAFIVIGVAFSVAAILLLVLPAVLILAMLQPLLGRSRS